MFLSGAFSRGHERYYKLINTGYIFFNLRFLYTNLSSLYTSEAWVTRRRKCFLGVEDLINGGAQCHECQQHGADVEVVSINRCLKFLASNRFLTASLCIQIGAF